MVFKRLFPTVLAALALASCSPEGTGKCYVQVFYNSSSTDPYTIEELSVDITENGLTGKDETEIAPGDYYHDDQTDIYMAEITTDPFCSAEIGIIFSEPENHIVSGSFSIDLEPGVIWSINIYPYRPPFFYVGRGNMVLAVDGEDRAVYGDSLYVKWDVSAIE